MGGFGSFRVVPCSSMYITVMALNMYFPSGKPKVTKIWWLTILTEKRLNSIQVFIKSRFYTYRPFPNLIFFIFFFLFRLHLRAFINTLVIYPQKINQHFQLIFQAILRLFSIEGHDQTSLKLTFIIFRFVFTK